MKVRVYLAGMAVVASLLTILGSGCAPSPATRIRMSKPLNSAPWERRTSCPLWRPWEGKMCEKWAIIGPVNKMAGR